ncbi:MAG: LPS export ABC transporter periplasmic protein LptC, partial [Burkholderiaceae bacterium]|nr:LPS export ABC transporter periplasmic protein LptC [Burkholderiaceae bacterium]
AVRLRSVTQAGHVIQGSADHAVSNADGTEVQLHGNAIVVREAMQPARGAAQPRMEFRGNFLHAWPQLERVRSDQPVTLTRGNNRFTADSMEYDNLEQVLQLRGRVRGEFAPVR